jgi:D-serine deaminase-like pyridoxal phosphate-dependent protein
VVSKPGENLLCLDLGYKAVAADNPDPRVLFPELPDARAVIHSEEHLTIYTTSAVRYAVGSCLYAIPWHVCPTVALYPEAIVIRGGRAAERIKIAARDRMLSI